MAFYDAGINVVLVSRTQAKLDTAASEIEAKFKVKTKTLAVDFGKADAGTWAMLKAELAPLQVGVLVNNVGVSYPHAEYYEAIDDQLIDDLVNINIQATNKVCTYPLTPSIHEAGNSAKSACCLTWQLKGKLRSLPSYGEAPPDLGELC